jgi:nitrogen regulatory protein P-II 1
MRLITAIVLPGVLPAVRAALLAFGATGLTVTQVSADVPWDRHVEVYRARVWVAELVPRVRLELVVDDYDVADLMRVITTAAATPRGDPGLAWAVPVDGLVRVRTGERGPAAL